MTAVQQLPTAAIAGNSYVVPARTETLIPGTPFAVWHDGDGDARVQVLRDGALVLSGSNDWIVGLAATWRGAAS